MKRVRLHAYRDDGRRYGKIRYAWYKGEVVAYRRMSGGRPGRKYVDWIICGRPKNKKISEKRRRPSEQKWIMVIPFQTSDERNDIRGKFGVFLHAPFIFLDPD